MSMSDKTIKNLRLTILAMEQKLEEVRQIIIINSKRWSLISSENVRAHSCCSWIGEEHWTIWYGYEGSTGTARDFDGVCEVRAFITDSIFEITNPFFFFSERDSLSEALSAMKLEYSAMEAKLAQAERKLHERNDEVPF